MRFTAISAACLALAQHVYAMPVDAEKVSALDVTLSHVSDTRIKAVVKNTGAENVTFVHLNFFRDSAPVKKVAIYQDGKLAFFLVNNPTFNGLRLGISTIDCENQ